LVVLAIAGFLAVLVIAIGGLIAAGVLAQRRPQPVAQADEQQAAAAEPAPAPVEPAAPPEPPVVAGPPPARPPDFVDPAPAGPRIAGPPEFRNPPKVPAARPPKVPAQERPAPAPAPAARFRLPPLKSRLEIEPAGWPGEVTTITLPGRAKDVCVGGDGRYLLCVVGAERQIVVVDVSGGKIVKSLPTIDDPALIAAGMDKSVVVYPQARLIERWSLLTLEREMVAPLPEDGTAVRAAVGSASAGPVFVTFHQDAGTGTRAGTFRVFDMNTLQSMEAHMDGDFSAGTHPSHPADLRVSADGRTVGLWVPTLSPTGVQIVTAADNGLTAVRDHSSAGAILPAPDGSVLFTAAGVYGRDGRPRGEQVMGQLLPAVHGVYHLKVDGVGLKRDGVTDKGTPLIRLFRTGDDRPVATLVAPIGLDFPNRPQAVPPPLPIDRRVHFVPKAGVLITVNAAGDQVYLQKLDPDARTAASGQDYLYVRSEPVADAERGTRFSRRIDVRSSRDGVRLKLESGPEGLVLNGDTLEWPVPAALPDSNVNVLVSVSDAQNQEVIHALTIRVLDRGATPKLVAVNSARPPVPAYAGFTVLKPAFDDGPTLKPPTLKNARTSLKLHGRAADDVCFGGDGQYLILRLPTQRELAVVDVSAAKVVKYLPLTEPNARIAAGRSRLVVALPRSQMLERWSLESFEKEQSARSPVPIGQIAMGSATHGPLLIQEPADRRSGKRPPLHLLDPFTFQDSGLKVVRGQPPKDARAPGMTDKRPLMSADGRLICGCGVYVRTADGYESTAAPDSATPGPEGRFLYGPARVGTPYGTQSGLHAFVEGAYVWNLAAAQGPYYFSINQVGTDEDPRAIELRLHAAGDRRPLYTDSERKIFRTFRDSWPGGGVPWVNRVFCVPDAEVMVVVSEDRNQVTLTRLNWKNGPDGRGLLYVANGPPPAERGATFRYRPLVRSTKGGVKGRLEFGPPGLKLTTDGLTWDVPRDFAGPWQDALVTLADSSGQEIVHTFRIAVYDPGEAPGPPRPEK
jgi:hypothetical protein